MGIVRTAAPPATARGRLEGAPFAIFLLCAFALAAALTVLADRAFGPLDGGVRLSDVPRDTGAPLALALALAFAAALPAVYLRVRWAWIYCAALAVAVGVLAVANGEIPLVSPIVLALCFRPSVRGGRPR